MQHERKYADKSAKKPHPAKDEDHKNKKIA